MPRALSHGSVGCLGVAVDDEHVGPRKLPAQSTRIQVREPPCFVGGFNRTSSALYLVVQFFPWVLLFPVFVGPFLASLQDCNARNLAVSAFYRTCASHSLMIYFLTYVKSYQSTVCNKGTFGDATHFLVAGRPCQTKSKSSRVKACWS
jgi:hypothetical protein